MGDGDHGEVADAVGEELAALGVNGSVLIGGGSIELRSGEGAVSIDIAEMLQQWPLLPEEMRRRRAKETARRLVTAQRSARPLGMPAGAGDDASRTKLIGAVAGLFGLLLVIGLARILIPRLSPPEKVETTPAREIDPARAARLARACEANRDRIYKGAGFGPLSLEGWAVDLWLVRKKEGSLRDHAAFAPLAGKKIPASLNEDLGKIIDGAVEVRDLDADAKKRSPAWDGAVVVFTDGYARAFLEPETRPAFVTLAERLFEATGAELGGLYGRCAHLATHDVGAWFHAADASGATASLVYNMGLFAETKLIDRSALASMGEGGEIDQLRKAAVSVEDSVLRMVGGQGSGSSKTRDSVTFLFQPTAPIRAVSVTREVARKMGVGVIGGD